jgi:hypothetical protein
MMQRLAAPRLCRGPNPDCLAATDNSIRIVCGYITPSLEWDIPLSGGKCAAWLRFFIIFWQEQLRSENPRAEFRNPNSEKQMRLNRTFLGKESPNWPLHGNLQTGGSYPL